MNDTKTIEIGCDSVAAGFYALFKQRPVLTQIKAKAISDYEMQAALLLFLTSRNDWAGWDAALEPVRSTAAALLMDFFVKVSQPRMNEYLGCTWRVASLDPVIQALDVLGQEIARSHPWLEQIDKE